MLAARQAKPGLTLPLAEDDYVRAHVNRRQAARMLRASTATHSAHPKQVPQGPPSSGSFALAPSEDGPKLPVGTW